MYMSGKLKAPFPLPIWKLCPFLQQIGWIPAPVCALRRTEKFKLLLRIEIRSPSQWPSLFINRTNPALRSQQTLLCCVAHQCLDRQNARSSFWVSHTSRFKLCWKHKLRSLLLTLTRTLFESYDWF